MNTLFEFPSLAPRKSNGSDFLEKICCFSGHRDISPETEEIVFVNVLNTIEKLYEEGYRIFKAGGAIGFDRIAADAVIALRQKHSDVELHVYIPCLDQNKFFSESENEHYLAQMRSANKVMCMRKSYTKGCMYERNRALVDGSDTLICYLRKNSGGTAYTVNYAIEQNKHVIRL